MDQNLIFNNRKLQVLTIVSLIFFITKIRAQNLEYGLGFGPSFTTSSKLDFHRATTPKGVGYFIYLHGNYQIKSRLSLNAKLGFDNKKVGYFTYGIANSSYNIGLNFLTFMPMLKVDLGANEQKGLYLKTGLRLSQLLTAKERKTNSNIKEDFKATNLGLNLGVGYDYGKYVETELILDYNINNEIKNSDSDKRLISLSFLININLDSFLSK